MSRDPDTAKAEKPTHLTVRSDGPPEVRFLFAQQEQRMGGALGLAVVAHAVFALLILIIASFVPERVGQAVLPDNVSEQIVWIAEPGPGGGGGGGNELPEPPRVAELPGPDPITVPVLEPPDPEPVEVVEDEPEPEPLLAIPARAMASAATVSAPGVVSPSDVSISRSTGSGRGTGAGAGEGSGLGEGTGGGFGGGVFRIGSGVESPRLLQSARPDYTSEAMRAKVQGIVRLEGVVLPDGSVGDVRIVRSLDPVFGLDEEAIKAAKRFRFEPGRRFGEPVAVLVSFEIEFTLR